MAVLNRIQIDGAAYDINAVYAERAENATNATNATNASLASTANIAKNSNAFGGQNIDYFAKRTDLLKTAFLYKALFSVTDWTGEGPYTQTVNITPIDGGPEINPNSLMVTGVFIDDLIQGEAQEQLLESANIINMGQKTFGDGTITCVIQNEKPISDVEIYCLVKTN